MSDLTLNHIYERVSKWNAARYEREHNPTLAHSLLLEEFTEYSTATKDVDKLDGLADVSFVALGILWKLSADEEQNVLDHAASDAFDFVEQLDSMDMSIYARPLVRGLIARFDEGTPLSNQSLIVISFSIVVLCMYISYLDFGFEPADFLAALAVVCDSNDTKPAVKTASDVKANIDKGDSFVPPEPRLQHILDKTAEIKDVH